MEESPINKNSYISFFLRSKILYIDNKCFKRNILEMIFNINKY